MADSRRELSGAKDTEALMSFGDHLDELRRRVFRALAAPIPLAILAFFFANHLRAVLERPLRDAMRAAGLPDQLQFLGVTEAMAVDLKLSFVFGVVVSSPWILWQLWKFIEPGLYEYERRFARLLIPGSILLTIAGILTLYFVLLPFSLAVLVDYGVEPRGGPVPTLNTAAIDPEKPAPPAIPLLSEAPATVRPGEAYVLVPQRLLCIPMSPDGTRIEIWTMALSKDSTYLQSYRGAEYHDFVLLMMLGVAVSFQMPLVILLLGWAGIVRNETLRKNRKYAIFVITIVSAVVTPTSDLTSMLLMLIPLYLLYELGIFLLTVVPPQAVSQGNVMSGLFRRVRQARSSGKRPAGAAQTERPTRTVQSEGPTRKNTHRPTGEPDGDADEDSAGGSRQ
ncbi:MAG: twin-arginine translocase subunit TatC [Phycisphaerae bacterium]|nr:twin-arginine translocase subunit TatC [Phycisphaerae bacterium]